MNMAFGYDLGKFDDIVAFLALDFVRVQQDQRCGAVENRCW